MTAHTSSPARHGPTPGGGRQSAPAANSSPARLPARQPWRGPRSCRPGCFPAPIAAAPHGPRSGAIGQDGPTAQPPGLRHRQQQRQRAEGPGPAGLQRSDPLRFRSGHHLLRLRPELCHLPLDGRRDQGAAPRKGIPAVQNPRPPAGRAQGHRSPPPGVQYRLHRQPADSLHGQGRVDRPVAAGNGRLPGGQGPEVDPRQGRFLPQPARPAHRGGLRLAGRAPGARQPAGQAYRRTRGDVEQVRQRTSPRSSSNCGRCTPRAAA